MTNGFESVEINVIINMILTKSFVYSGTLPSHNSRTISTLYIIGIIMIDNKKKENLEHIITN